MSLNEQILQLLRKIKMQGQNLFDELGNGTDIVLFVQRAGELSQVILGIKRIIPHEIYQEYQEFFEAFSRFCGQCTDLGFMENHADDMASSLSLLVECVEDIEGKCIQRIRKCVCCGHEIIYQPLTDYYSKMKEKFHVSQKGKPETLNCEEYSCPVCGASDRDRMIISFLKKEQLRDAAEGTKVLQIAPADAISWWISQYCPQIVYETTDLSMEGVTFHSDLQDMNMLADETYDVIICSHVLEHVQNDKKALSEMRRILKPDGRIIFLVPIDLNREVIDEEWGLSEAENWKRFGQGDHCRAYSKKGLMDRLQEQFYVHSLGKEYFGADTFGQCGLTDTSVLYVLTKEEKVSLNMA